MSGIYPSLEDMKVDSMMQAQNAYAPPQPAASTTLMYTPGSGGAAPPAYAPAYPEHQGSSLYPSLQDYMGLSLSPEDIEQHMPVVAANPVPDNQVVTRASSSGHMQIAPITGDNIGLRRAEIKQGIREIQLCKDGDGKIGLRVRAVNKGIFVAFVHADSPASLVGLRFGDQILQINGENVAGWDTDKAMKVIKKCAPESIKMAIRDRPFDRTITLHKDSTGHIGFVFKEGKITAIVKDSSAARNGVLIDHQLVEINGQNVVGMKDKEIGEVINQGGSTITITIVPSYIYAHIIKSMGSSLIKKYMDHSIPDV